MLTTENVLGETAPDVERGLKSRTKTYLTAKSADDDSTADDLDDEVEDYGYDDDGGEEETEVEEEEEEDGGGGAGGGLHLHLLKICLSVVLFVAAFFRTRSAVSALYLIVALLPHSMQTIPIVAATSATAVALAVSNAALVIASAPVGDVGTLFGLWSGHGSLGAVFGPDAATFVVSAAVATSLYRNGRRRRNRLLQLATKLSVRIAPYAAPFATLTACVAAASAPGLLQATLPAFAALAILLRSVPSTRSLSVSYSRQGVAQTHDWFCSNSFAWLLSGVLFLQHATGIYDAYAHDAAKRDVLLLFDTSEDMYDRGNAMTNRRAHVPSMLSRAATAVSLIVLRLLQIPRRDKSTPHLIQFLPHSVALFMEHARLPLSRVSSLMIAVTYRGVLGICLALIFVSGRVRKSVHGYGAVIVSIAALVQSAIFLSIGATERTMCDNQVPESEKGSSDACGKLAYRIGSTFFGYVRFQLWPDLYPWLGSNYFLRVLLALLIGALCYLLHVLGERKPELSSRTSKSPSLARTVSGDSTPRTHLQSIGLITFKKLQRLQTTVWSGIMQITLKSRYGIRFVIWLVPLTGLLVLTLVDSAGTSSAQSCSSSASNAAASKALPTLHLLYLLTWVMAPTRELGAKDTFRLRVMRSLLIVELLLRYSWQPLKQVIRMTSQEFDEESSLVFCVGLKPTAGELITLAFAVIMLEISVGMSKPAHAMEDIHHMQNFIGIFRPTHDRIASAFSSKQTISPYMRSLMRNARLAMCRVESAVVAAACVLVFTQCGQSKSAVDRSDWWGRRKLSCVGNSCASAVDVLVLSGVLIVVPALLSDRMKVTDSASWISSRMRVRYALRYATRLFAAHMLISYFIEGEVERELSEQVPSAAGMGGALFGLLLDLTASQFHDRSRWLPLVLFLSLDYYISFIHELEDEAACAVQTRYRIYVQRRIERNDRQACNSSQISPTSSKQSWTTNVKDDEKEGEQANSANPVYDATSEKDLSSDEGSGYVTPASDDDAHEDEISSRHKRDHVLDVPPSSSNPSEIKGSADLVNNEKTKYRWLLFLEVTRSALRNVIVYWAIAVGLSYRPSVIDACYLMYFVAHLLRHSSLLATVSAAAAQLAPRVTHDSNEAFNHFCLRTMIFGIVRIMFVLICRNPLTSITLFDAVSTKATLDWQWIGIPVLPLREPLKNVDGLSVSDAIRPYLFFVYMCMLYLMFFTKQHTERIPKHIRLENYSFMPLLMNWMGLPMECFVIVAAFYPLNFISIGYAFVIGWALRRRNVRMANLGPEGRVRSIHEFGGQKEGILSYFDRIGSDKIVKISVLLFLLQYIVAFDVMPSAYHQYYAFYSDLNYILQATWRFAVGRDPYHEAPPFIGDTTTQSMLGIAASFGVVHSSWFIRSADEAFEKPVSSTMQILRSNTLASTVETSKWRHAKSSFSATQVLNRLVVRKGYHTAIMLLLIELLLLSSTYTPDLINLGYHGIILHLTFCILRQSRRLESTAISGLLARYNIAVIYLKLGYQLIDPFVTPRNDTRCPPGTRNCGVRWPSVIGLYRLYASRCSVDATDEYKLLIDPVCAESALALGKGLAISILVFLLCSMYQRLESMALCQDDDDTNSLETVDEGGVPLLTHKRLKAWSSNFDFASEKRVNRVVQRAQMMLDELSESSSMVDNWLQEDERIEAGGRGHMGQPVIDTQQDDLPVATPSAGKFGSSNATSVDRIYHTVPVWRDGGVVGTDEGGIRLRWMPMSDVQMYEILLRRDAPAYLGEHCRVLMADGSADGARVPFNRVLHLIRPIGTSDTSLDLVQLSRTPGMRYRIILSMRARHEDGFLGKIGEEIIVEHVCQKCNKDSAKSKARDPLASKKRRERAYGMLVAAANFIEIMCRHSLRLLKRLIDPVLFPRQLKTLEKMWKLQKSSFGSESKVEQSKAEQQKRPVLALLYGASERLFITLKLIVPSIILSHTELYVQIVYVAAAAYDAAFLTALPVGALMLYYVVEYPLAPRRAWLTLAAYSMLLLAYRYLFQMDAFCFTFDEISSQENRALLSTAGHKESPDALKDVVDRLAFVPKGRFLIGDPRRWYISVQPYCPATESGSWPYASSIDSQSSYARAADVFWSLSKRGWKSHHMSMLRHLLLDVLSLFFTILHIRSLHLKGLWHDRSLDRWHGTPAKVPSSRKPGTTSREETRERAISVESVGLSLSENDGDENVKRRSTRNFKKRRANVQRKANALLRRYANAALKLIGGFMHRTVAQNAVYSRLSRVTVESVARTPSRSRAVSHADKSGEPHGKLGRLATFVDAQSSIDLVRESGGEAILKPGIDLYPSIFFVEVILLALAIAYAGDFRPDDSALPLSEDLRANRFSAFTVVAAMLHVALIIVNRACYLRIDMRARVVFHCIEVTVVHVMLFFILPYLSSDVGVRLSVNWKTRTYYAFFALHMAMSARQIRYGYVASSEVHQSFFRVPDHVEREEARAADLRSELALRDPDGRRSSRQYDVGDVALKVRGLDPRKSVLALPPVPRCMRCFKRRMIGYGYIVFAKLPFVLELTSLLDWTFTDTCLDPFSWLIFVTVAHKVHVAKLFRDAKRDDMDHTHGVRRQNLCCKCWQGTILAGLLLLVLLLPIALFSDLNPTLAPNPVGAAMMSVSMRYEIPVSERSSVLAEDLLPSDDVPWTSTASQTRTLDLIPFPPLSSSLGVDLPSTSYIHPVDAVASAVRSYGMAAVGTGPTVQCATWDAVPSHDGFFVSLEGLKPLRDSLFAAAQGKVRPPVAAIRFAFRRRGPPGAETVVTSTAVAETQAGTYGNPDASVGVRLTKEQCAYFAEAIDGMSVRNTTATTGFTSPDVIGDFVSLELRNALPTAYRLYPLSLAPRQLHRLPYGDAPVDMQNVRLSLRSSVNAGGLYWTLTPFDDTKKDGLNASSIPVEPCERRTSLGFVSCICGRTDGASMVLFSDRYLRGLVENLSLPSYGIGILYITIITTLGYGLLRAFLLNLWTETPIYAMRHPEKLEGICQAMRTLRGINYPSKHVDEARLYRLLMRIVSDQHVMSRFTSSRRSGGQHAHLQ